MLITVRGGQHTIKATQIILMLPEAKNVAKYLNILCTGFILVIAHDLAIIKYLTL